jgi:putative transposase
MALMERRPQPGLVHHSDRGVQYASQAYTELLKQHQAQISMSRKGNPYDNAYASHCTSFEHSDTTDAAGRRLLSFLPCAFLGPSEPVGSYRYSGLSV